MPLRGVAVAAVTGGALSLIAVTVPPAPADEAAAALRLTAEPEDEELDDDSESDKDSDEDDDDDEDDDSDEDDDDVERRPSVEPVPGSDSDDDRFDVDELLESVKRAEAEAVRAAERKRGEDEERARRAAEERAAQKAREQALRGDCEGLRTSGLGAVKAHVRDAGGFLGCRFGKPLMLGVAGRGGPSDHPAGLAIDFMVNRATGDALAQCALDNMQALGVKYVIWRQRINHGNGWQPMADRGGVTANHFDHVHVSFERGKADNGLRGC